MYAGLGGKVPVLPKNNLMNGGYTPNMFKKEIDTYFMDIIMLK